MNWEVVLTPRPAASCSLRRRPLPSSSLCSSSFEARRGKVGGAEGSGRVNSLSQPQSARQTKQGEKSSTRLRSLFAESAALSERLEPAPLAGCPQNKQKTGLKRSASESCFVKTLRTHHRAAFWAFRGTDLPSASQNPRSCTRGNRRSGAFGLILHKDLFFSWILFRLSCWEGSWSFIPENRDTDTRRLLSLFQTYGLIYII